MTKPSKGSRAVMLTPAENWAKHNENSTNKEDLTPIQKQEQRIAILRSRGVPNAELVLAHEIPLDKQNQDNGGFIDTMVANGRNLINTWTRERQDYYYLLIFGGRTSQALGDMGAIERLIEERIRPQLRAIIAQIRQAGGRAMYPPRCFDVEVNELKVPLAPRRRRH